jgi:hypothetical protein
LKERRNREEESEKGVSPLVLMSRPDNVADEEKDTVKNVVPTPGVPAHGTDHWHHQHHQQQQSELQILAAIIQKEIDESGRPYNNYDNGNNIHDGRTTTTSATTTTHKNNNMKIGGGIVVGGIIVGLLGLQFPFLFPKSAPYMATPGRKIRRALQFLNETKKNNNTTNPHDPHPNVVQFHNATATSTRTPTTATTTTTGMTKSLLQSIRPQQLEQHHHLPQQRTFVDLGSGDGQAVYEAAKLGYTAIGIEFNWALWGLSLIRRIVFWPEDVRARSKFICGDFTHYNLSHADTVMIFAVPRTMPILGKKIQAECKSGTTVLAYRFAIPLAQTQHQQQQDDKNYNKGTTMDDDKGRHNKDGNNVVANDNSMLLNADLVYDQEDMRIYRMKEKKSPLL